MLIVVLKEAKSRIHDYLKWMPIHKMHLGVRLSCLDSSIRRFMNRPRKDFVSQASCRMTEAFMTNLHLSMRMYTIRDLTCWEDDDRRLEAIIENACEMTRQALLLQPAAKRGTGGVDSSWQMIRNTLRPLLQQPTLHSKLRKWFEKYNNGNDPLAEQQRAAGLKWEGCDMPQGSQLLTNDKLAEALEQKQEFTRQEWEAFGINDLQTTDVVKVGSKYFKPVENACHEIQKRINESQKVHAQTLLHAVQTTNRNKYGGPSARSERRVLTTWPSERMIREVGCCTARQ